MKYSDPIEAFIKALRLTSELVSYFPGGYDFQVSPFDPVIEDLIELAEEDTTTVEELLGDPSDDEVFEIIFSHAPRLIADQHRLDLFEILCGIEKKAPRKHLEHIRTAKIGLEDSTMNPAYSGFVFALFAGHISEKVKERSLIEYTVCDAEILELVKKAVSSKNAQAWEEIKSLGERALPTLQNYLLMENIEKEVIESITGILASIPGFHSALLLFHIFRGKRFGQDSMAEVIEQSPARPFLLTFLKNEHNKFFVSWEVRRQIEEILCRLDDPAAFHLLRRELVNPRHWMSHAPPEEMPGFYGTVVKHLLEIGDRRAVPVLIKFLQHGASEEIPGEVVSEVKHLVEGSTWHDEIVQGLKLLAEGEKVFVEFGEDLTEIALQKVNQFSDFHTQIQGKAPTLDELNRRLRIEQDRFNNAYHDDLDGLRPVDMGKPPIQMILMQRMLEDFEKRGGSGRFVQAEEADELAEFQAEWLITPLPDYNGEAPEVIIMRKREQHASLRAEREYIELYGKRKINELYIDASEFFDEGINAPAQKRIDVVLALEPNHLFARRLEGLLKGHPPSETPEAAGGGEAVAPLTRLDILKPFFADVLFAHRKGLKNAIAAEVDALRSQGMSDPVIDDSQFRFFEKFVTGALTEFRKKNISPMGTFDRDEWAMLARCLEIEYFSLVNFGLFGERVFYIAPHLAERLMETDMNVDGALLRLPFRSCAFIYQDPQFIQLFHRCFGDENLVPEYDSPVTIFLTELENGGRRSLVIVTARASSSFIYYGITQRTLNLSDGVTIEDALRTDWQALGGTPVEGAMPDSFFYDDLRLTFYRTIINSILYLSTGNAELTEEGSPLQELRRQEKEAKSRKKREKIARKGSKMREAYSGYPYIIVGKSTPETELSPLFMKEDCVKWRTLTKRFMVRGHWKYQAHGKEFKERRLIWIEPYYKGPANVAETVNKPYIVEN